MNILKVTDKTVITTPDNIKSGNIKTAPADDQIKIPPSNLLTSPLGSPSQMKASRPKNVRRALPPSPTLGKRSFRTRNNHADSQRATPSLHNFHDSLYLRLLEKTRRHHKNPRVILSVYETQDDGAPRITAPTITYQAGSKKHE
ncbi:hypothetical protein BOTCAL_0929g00020 [Botryotinia calthae]|uniref:Uncharacterized protein n=1 Tax=Botryotinia calthae TaxID=38488 RepID=A0A4Y8CEU7_9HELO|nr:hypothetical protein BOTCAL_0929g00020 [Botryotinia calthae]